MSPEGGELYGLARGVGKGTGGKGKEGRDGGGDGKGPMSGQGFSSQCVGLSDPPGEAYNRPGIPQGPRKV